METVAPIAVEALLAGDHPVLAKLRQQAAVATMAVDRTEVGGFAHFTLPDGVPICEPPSLTLDDVHLQIFGRVHPTACLLFVKDGRIDGLECYDVADEDWPEFPQVERIQYLRHVERPAVRGTRSWLAEPVEVRDVGGLAARW